MPQVSRQDWRASKRKLRRSERAALIAVGVLVAISVVVPGLSLLTAPKALAIGPTGPDPGDFQGRQILFTVDNTTYVGANTTTVMVYFKNLNGNTVTVNNAGANSLGVYDFFNTPFSGNPVITQFDVLDPVTKRSIAASPCDARINSTTCSISINFPPGTAVDIQTGYYVAQFQATLILPPGTNWVFQNGFWLTLGQPTDVVGFDSSTAATRFAMQEKLDDKQYTDWKLKFGSDCTVPPGGRMATFTYFDPDNENPRVQPEKASFRIMDVTALPGYPQVVVLSNPRGNDFAGKIPAVLDPATNRVTPGDNSRTTGMVDFRALPSHIYQVEYDHVWPNNTLQFQLPFDSIFYKTGGCKASPYGITPSLTNTLAPPAHLEQGTTYINTFFAIATLAFGGPTSKYDMTVTHSGSADSPLNIYSNLIWKDEPGFAGPGSVTRGFSVTVANSVPDGTTLCFRNTIYPAAWDPSTGFVSSFVDMCLPVYRTRYPAVQGFKGDIHAGGGLCQVGSPVLAGAGSPGYVKGNANSNSLGEYVVSASDVATSITNFGSANTRNGTRLNLGTAGQYSRACRPDLLAAALNYQRLGVNVQTIPLKVVGPTDFNTSGLSGVYFFDGGPTDELNIHGVVDNSLTIVRTQPGIVRVSGDIVRNPGSYTAHGAPSLGVISAGDIVIPAATLNVDAYLFANVDIDTCVEGQNLLTVRSCSTPQLVINGFLMAKDIKFHRLGAPSASGSTTSERVNLSAQIYLNPPKLFDVSVDSNFEDGQGERQPLF